LEPQQIFAISKTLEIILERNLTYFQTRMQRLGKSETTTISASNIFAGSGCGDDGSEKCTVISEGSDESKGSSSSGRSLMNSWPIGAVLNCLGCPRKRTTSVGPATQYDLYEMANE
jgi:hypothetical protein